TNQDDSTVSIINGVENVVVSTVPVSVLPQGIALNPATHAVYVANREKDSVSVIDGATNKVTATVPVISAAEAEKLDVALK
ncbi:YncE family protein, partial [Legionella drancourtii]|uniref:YncE family protein n=1 Tax=Legionella drancourtii TaxID=168933 RepID=UPI0018F14AB1